MEDVHWNDIYYEVSSTGLDRHGLYSHCTIKAGKQYVSVIITWQSWFRG